MLCPFIFPPFRISCVPAFQPSGLPAFPPSCVPAFRHSCISSSLPSGVFTFRPSGFPAFRLSRIPAMALILGVDPGSRHVGLGLVNAEHHQITFKTAHILSLKNPSVPDRLGAVLGTFMDYLKEWKPDAVAVEDTFHSKNVRSLVVMARVSGVIVGAARHLGYPLYLYTPAVVKKTVTGTGQADKEQVAYMVKRYLNLTGDAPQDALDALAVAITHAHSAGL